MPKAGRVVIALIVTSVLFVALAVLVTSGLGLEEVAAQNDLYNTLRVYGRANQGAGWAALVPPPHS